MSEPAVSLADLRVRAGRRVILSVDRLRIERGEMLALLGPNGAGKSTLIRCCLGLQHHAAGEVCILGRRLGASSPWQLARLRRRIGYVPQLLPAGGEMPLTVREVVAIGRTGIAGLLRPLGGQDWRIVDQWLGRLGLADLAGRGFGQISGGEQRKTLLARAMVQQPQLLLLDEPAANLDLGWRERIVRIVDELYRAAGMTVVLVCHQLELLPPSCSRVAVLTDGHVRADGPRDRVITADLVGRLYGPGLQVIHAGGRTAVVPEGVVRA